VAVEIELEPQLRVVAVGHVDHGKSTLIGRLLHDTGNLADGKVAELKSVSEKRGAEFEWSFVLDALQSERDQAVTIDTTRIWMRTPKRDIVLIDAPGHKEFLRNMVTGASDADAAMLLVDACDGVSEQTRRHALLLELIGVTRVVVVINKMDRVDYAAARYAEVRAELVSLLDRIGIVPAAFVPTCARDGENVVAPERERMHWYDGPTVLEALLAVPSKRRDDEDALRIAVQGIVRRDLQRIVTGRIESGTLAVGQEIVVSPLGQRARIATIETFPVEEKATAVGGESVGFTLDKPLFVDRGDVIADAQHAPPLGTAFRARLLWLGEKPLALGDSYRIRFGTRTASVEVMTFERVIDIESLERPDADVARANDVAEVVFASSEMLPLDTVGDHPGLGRFIVLDGIDIVAGGTILAPVNRTTLNKDVVPVGHLVGRNARERRNGHRGAVLWLTGLPAAGKSTLAMELERRLFERGTSVYVLDGDNVRSGLNADLGFSPADREENVRRVGEVAALFADSGTIVIAAFISPYRKDRETARRASSDSFHEVYVKADVAVREARDPKGHYARARSGDLPDFSGISEDYEEPKNPEIVIDTGSLALNDAVDVAMHYLRDKVFL
jgi:bifunctional enzyme CysN/CysC